MTRETAPAALSPAPVEAPTPKIRLPVLPVASLLEAQHTMTAVERFARHHDDGDLPAQAKHYRDLIPLERPRPGEQYAFEVDLDACTGCKACVSACHTLNGLDEAEVWRTVGLLHGGSPSAPAQQTVTTSCHHCLEPGCLTGCPVRAYEKDPVTGIVKHLDDQCIGCQYCMLMCPFDAPKYNEAMGVVRKCDMCSDRLAHDEAPACAQACPNQAIAVRIVDRATVIETADAGKFLPGAPGPEYTLPTTVYMSRKPMPANLLPADFYRTDPGPSHPALVALLTLTQLSVGAFGLSLLAQHLSGKPAGSPFVHSVIAGVVALLALGASLFHLGRPWLAWRAVLGLRTSWLSRESLAFTVFTGLALTHALLVGAPVLGSSLVDAGVASAVQTITAVAGALGVFCSIMVYVATGRAHWSAAQTGIRFSGTVLLLGAAAVLTVWVLTGHEGELRSPAWRALSGLVLVTALLKIAFEAGSLCHARDRRHSALKRVALVMLGELRLVTVVRFAALLTGGVVLPLGFLLSGFEDRLVAPATVAPATVEMLLLLLGGEVAERYLFFRAAPASRMPGGPR